MGVVVDHLARLIQRQVVGRHLVVWFDPERHYGEVAAGLALALPEARVERYEGSFFALRRAVDELLNDDLPPRLVVYVPLDAAETDEALAELAGVGVVMGPGQPGDRNTRLAVVARAALAQTLPEEVARQLAEQVEAGALGLADVERVVEQGGGEELGFLATLFEAGTVQEVALAFLASEVHDGELVARGLLGQLAQALSEALGAALAASSPAALRAQLARLLLAREFVDALPGQAPAALGRSASPSRAVREASARLVAAWRNRRDLQQAYAAEARRVEADLHLSSLDLALDQLGAAETFPEVERRLQAQLEAELLRRPAPELVEQAERRMGGFWAQQDPTHLARWATIAAAGRVLLEAAWVRQEMRAVGLAAPDLARRYAGGDRPWCQLDTAHRHLERLFLGLDVDLEDEHRALEQLVARARQAYAEAADELAERFTHALAEARFDLAGLPRQRDAFGRYVRPAIERAKTAYVLVDALRFEMARELAQGLDDLFACELEVAVGTVPTITEVGMAALMPGMDGCPTLLEAGKGKLALEVGEGRALRSRADRLRWLEEQVSERVFSASLETFSPPNRATRQAVQGAGLVVLWSQEIDEFSEGGNVPMARSAMDAALVSLRRAFRTLASLGVQSIVVSADHGYLFGEEPESGMTLDPPGGQEVDRHRRVWVGRGGASQPGALRARAADFGLGGDLEIVTPWNTAVFRAGGARAYFHGGLSPQELLVPVLRLRPRRARLPGAGARIRWTLTPGSARITTRFCTITVAGESADLLELVPPRVRLEIRVDDRASSSPVAASYGYDAASQEVQLARRAGDERALEPCSLTLQLIDPPSSGAAVACLLDAQSGAELARLEGLAIKLSL